MTLPTPDRRSELIGRVSVLNLLQPRIQHLAARYGVKDGAAMYRVLTEVTQPMLEQYQEHLNAATEEAKVEATLEREPPPIDIVRSSGVAELLRELHDKSNAGEKRDRIARVLANLGAAGVR